MREGLLTATIERNGARGIRARAIAIRCDRREVRDFDREPEVGAERTVIVTRRRALGAGFLLDMGAFPRSRHTPGRLTRFRDRYRRAEYGTEQADREPDPRNEDATSLGHESQYTAR